MTYPRRRDVRATFRSPKASCSWYQHRFVIDFFVLTSSASARASGARHGTFQILNAHRPSRCSLALHQFAIHFQYAVGAQEGVHLSLHRFTSRSWNLKKLYLHQPKFNAKVKQCLRSASSPAPPPSTAALRPLPSSLFLLSGAPEISFSRTAGQAEPDVAEEVARAAVVPGADGTVLGIEVPAAAAPAAEGGD